MDYKYIEQLLERYFAAETSYEEESILRTFFHQEEIPAHLRQWRALFEAEADEMLGDEFDARMLELIGEEPQTVKAREVKLSQRLKPLFKAAAVVAIFLTLGGAIQASWDSNWNDPEDYAALRQDADTVVAVQPVRAENIGDVLVTDSTQVMVPSQSTN